MNPAVAMADPGEQPNAHLGSRSPLLWVGEKTGGQTDLRVDIVTAE